MACLKETTFSDLATDLTPRWSHLSPPGATCDISLVTVLAGLHHLTALVAVLAVLSLHHHTGGSRYSEHLILHVCKLEFEDEVYDGTTLPSTDLLIKNMKLCLNIKVNNIIRLPFNATSIACKNLLVLLQQRLNCKVRAIYLA